MSDEGDDRERELAQFRAYARMAEELIASASKEQVADVARILALSVAHHEAEHGELPLASFEELMRTQEIDGETAGLLHSSMETLAGVLALVLGDTGDSDASVH